jgi:hypothetical protein
MQKNSEEADGTNGRRIFTVIFALSTPSTVPPYGAISMRR